MVSKWIQNATRNAISKRNFETQPQTPPPDDEKAASSEISKRNSLDLIPGCCTKVRRPHGTKTVEIHQICTSGFRTQSERNRNAIKTQQSLILAQIPRTSTNTFPLTCSKYVRHLKVLLFTIDCWGTNSTFHFCSTHNFKTQPDCESDVQIASKRNFGTQVQNATKKAPRELFESDANS